MTARGGRKTEFLLRASTALALLAALVIFGVRFARSRDGGDGVHTRAIEFPAVSTQALELESAPEGVESSARASAESAPPAAVTPAAESPAPTVAPFRMHGRVLDSELGLAVPDVHLRFMGGEDSRSMWKVAVDADADGEFTAELPGAAAAPGSMAVARLTDAHKTVLFTGPLAIAAEVVIPVRGQLVLSGKLVFSNAREPSACTVTFFVPPASNVGVPQFCGTANVDPTGAFLFSFRPAIESASYQLMIGCDGRNLSSVEVATSVLRAPGGALVRVESARLELLVRDETGAAIAAAKVRASADALADFSPVSAETGADGTLVLDVPRGRLDLGVAKPGHAPHMETLKAAPRERYLVVLRRLKPDDVLEGLVVDEADKPVAGAKVTCWPSDLARPVAYCGMQHETTDEQGRFRVAAARGQPWNVIALQKGFAEPRPLHCTPEDGLVRIRLHPSTSLQVRLRARPGSKGSSEGPVQFFLVDRHKDVVIPGFSNEIPFTISSVADGDYNLFVLLGQDGYGEAALSFDRRRARRMTVEVEMGDAVWFDGLLCRADGTPLEGLDVTCLHPLWPGEVRATWGAITSDAQGRFRVLGGWESSIEVQAREHGRERARGRLARERLTTLIAQ